MSTLKFNIDFAQCFNVFYLVSVQYDGKQQPSLQGNKYWKPLNGMRLPKVVSDGFKNKIFLCFCMSPGICTLNEKQDTYVKCLTKAT